MKAKIMGCDESMAVVKLYYFDSKEENSNEDNSI